MCGVVLVMDKGEIVAVWEAGIFAVSHVRICYKLWCG